MRGRSFARIAVLAAVLACFLTGCSETAGSLLETMADIAESAGTKTVAISSDEWYYGHKKEFSPDAWAGDAVLDLKLPGFSIRELSVPEAYTEPVVINAGRGKIKSVTVMLDHKTITTDWFRESLVDGLPGYEYNSSYPGIVPGNLFLQVPAVPIFDTGRYLATWYAWTAGIEPCFHELVNNLTQDPELGILFRSTAVYSAMDDMPCGFLLEYQSLDGRIAGCKYVYNVQPGISFDYVTGRNWITAAGDPEAESEKAT